MMRKIHLMTILVCVILMFPIQINAQAPRYGISRLIDLSALPILDQGITVNYEGSIDKKGANADWDWWLYQDQHGEWVIFDVSGPGCIYNFVQHRYPDSEEPVFRFYFDGETTPRFSMRASEFGQKHPFIEPLASRYIGPYENGRGPIRVIRSFIPMPFQNGCRITSSVKLEGYDRAKGHGGWGHVVYHSYTSADGIESFTGKEDYTPLVQLWKRTGNDPISIQNKDTYISSQQTITPQNRLELINKAGSGAINSVRLYIEDMNPAYLQDLWIHITWDDHKKPDVSCPIGCFFGNSLGYHDTKYLLMGASADGWFYNFFPMPFWSSASISIENRGNESIRIGFAEVGYSNDKYDCSRSGYFRSSDYYERKRTPGVDSRIGTISGTGKLVAAHVTAYGERPNIITCEGDVRVYIDGMKTPQIESDGSESYVCYGWGFPTPPETHPSGGYDGLPDNPWSMTRLCMGDSYPFYSGLLFGIESGENNNQYLAHSGILFYYGKDQISLIKTDSIDVSLSKSIKQHKYQLQGLVSKEELDSFYEGDNDHIPVKGQVNHFTGYSSFTIKISPQNIGVRLRRRSDQINPGQCARVFVDGEEVSERLWFFADRNPYKRWLDDEFEIPLRFTTGKSSIQVRIVPVEVGKTTHWNESVYQVYCHMPLD